jgi:cobalt-precorrin 5A hydrolase
LKKQIAIITLSDEGNSVALILSQKLQNAQSYVHESVQANINSKQFSSALDLVADIFTSYDGLIFIGPCGVAVRAIAPHVSTRTKDPAVIVLDVCARWAISLLSGNEGGANALALEVANILGADPVITTTSESRKNIIIGVGFKRGSTSDAIKAAIQSAMRELRLSIGDVRFIATVDTRAQEKGFHQAAEELQITVRLISSVQIMNSTRDFCVSDMRQETIGAPGVSEPCALLAGVRTKLIHKRKNYDGITIAIAREDCL